MTGPARTRRTRVKTTHPAVALALAAAMPLAWLAGCADEPTSPEAAGPGATPEEARAPARDWPAGTVVAVDEVPVSLDEVDLASVWIERIEPGAAGRQLRRLALTNVSLLRALAEAAAPEERLAARAEAEAQIERLRAGQTGPPTAEGGYGEVADGNWQLLGIPLWGRAFDWIEGEWHLIEEPGRFLVARRLARADQPHPTATSIRVDSFAFPWLPEGFDLDASMEEHRLTIVDPEWREIVPERTQYRMGVYAKERP